MKMENIEEYIKILIKLAKKASKKSEVPVSALIVYKGKIISKFHNKKNIKGNPLYHAEILCINKACKKLHTWNLNGCIMFVTLEPCDMCKNIIEESRIEEVYYLCKKGQITNRYKKTTYEQMYGNSSRDYNNMLKTFFKKFRK